MKIFAATVNGWKLLIIATKLSILDSCEAPGRASAQWLNKCLFKVKNKNTRTMPMGAAVVSNENKKALAPFYHKNIFDRQWM